MNLKTFSAAPKGDQQSIDARPAYNRVAGPTILVVSPKDSPAGERHWLIDKSVLRTARHTGTEPSASRRGKSLRRNRCSDVHEKSRRPARASLLLERVGETDQDRLAPGRAEEAQANGQLMHKARRHRYVR